jgi:hypothetical protein
MEWDGKSTVIGAKSRILGSFFFGIFPCFAWIDWLLPWIPPKSNENKKKKAFFAVNGCK